MKTQSGNALWFILIAIVLLGALTMALSRSGSNVTQTGDVERLRVTGSQILRYSKSLQSAIEQMTSRGVSENDISFEHSSPAVYVNAACTTTDCKIFDAGGGGLEYRPPPSGAGAADWIFTGANNVGTTADPIGTTAAASGNDLIMLLADVDPDLCKQINRDLRVGTAGTLPEDASGVDTTAFAGTYLNALKIIDGNGAPFELDGHDAGCFTDTQPNPDVVYFYYVLLAR